MTNLSLTIIKNHNVLVDKTCYEPVDRVVLEKLMNSDLLINNFKNPITRDMIGCEKKQLQKYKSITDRETNKAKIKYTRPKGMSYGRSNPVGAIGFFCMRKKIRHTLSNVKNLIDVDIINAHPDMLLQICKENGLMCDKLESYVENRDAILIRIQNLTACDRERAKVLFIRLLFFGSFENWLKEEKDEKNVIVYPEIFITVFDNDLDLIHFINEFTLQLKNIGEHIRKSNPKLEKEVEKNIRLKKKKNNNKIGTIVSFFLQEYEIRVLECLYIYCCDKGYIKEDLCVLCADGIMLEKELIKDADILAEFNAIVKEKIGFNLRFAVKEMNEDMIDILDEHIITSKMLDMTKFSKFDNVYFKELINYVSKKTYFEMFVCKVLRPDPVYIYRENEEDGFDALCFYNQNKIIETFNHIKSGEICDNGEETKFITKWLGDENIKCYNSMNFLPFNDKNPIDSNIFNLFRGFNEYCKTEYDYSKKDKLLKPFMDLGLEICGGNTDHFEYMLNYIADIFQNPNQKNPVAFIIKGKQGAGKNVWLNGVGNTMGKQHYITSSNPKDFFGDYAEGFYHKLLVNMNECEGKDTFDFEGRMKSFITEDTIMLNRKFVQPVSIKNVARLIIFSNKPNPVAIDIRSGDRRYVVFETTEKYLEPKYNTIFWSQLVAFFNRPDFIACLYDFFNEKDIKNFDWRSKRPITKAYIQMSRIYVPAEALFLEHKIVSILERKMILPNKAEVNEEGTDENIVSIEGKDFYKEYTTFCKEYGFLKDASYQKNLKCFYSRLTELGLPLMLSKPHNIITYSFNINETLNFMKERKWTDKSDEEKVAEANIEIVEPIEFINEFEDYFNI